MFEKIKALLNRFLGQTTENPAKLIDVPVPFREALALHNIFMAFGIPEQDIYVAYTNKCFQVVAYQDAKSGSVLFDDTVKTEKSKRREFFVDVAKLDLSKESFIAAWNKVTVLYNSSTTEERIAATENTKAYENILLIVSHMIAKGFQTDTVKSFMIETDSKDKNSGELN